MARLRGLPNGQRASRQGMAARAVWAARSPAPRRICPHPAHWTPPLSRPHVPRHFQRRRRSFRAIAPPPVPAPSPPLQARAAEEQAAAAAKAAAAAAPPAEPEAEAEPEEPAAQAVEPRAAPEAPAPAALQDHEEPAPATETVQEVAQEVESVAALAAPEVRPRMGWGVGGGRSIAGQIYRQFCRWRGGPWAALS